MGANLAKGVPNSTARTQASRTTSRLQRKAQPMLPGEEEWYRVCLQANLRFAQYELVRGVQMSEACVFAAARHLLNPERPRHVFIKCHIAPGQQRFDNEKAKLEVQRLNELRKNPKLAPHLPKLLRTSWMDGHLVSAASLQGLPRPQGNVLMLEFEPQAGDLLGHLVQEGCRLTERQAAELCYQLLTALDQLNRGGFHFEGLSRFGVSLTTKQQQEQQQPALSTTQPSRQHRASMERSLQQTASEPSLAAAEQTVNTPTHSTTGSDGDFWLLPGLPFAVSTTVGSGGLNAALATDGTLTAASPPRAAAGGSGATALRTVAVNEIFQPDTASRLDIFDTSSPSVPDEGNPQQVKLRSLADADVWGGQPPPGLEQERSEVYSGPGPVGPEDEGHRSDPSPKRGHHKRTQSAPSSDTLWSFEDQDENRVVEGGTTRTRDGKDGEADHARIPVSPSPHKGQLRGARNGLRSLPVAASAWHGPSPAAEANVLKPSTRSLGGQQRSRASSAASRASLDSDSASTRHVFERTMAKGTASAKGGGSWGPRTPVRCARCANSMQPCADCKLRTVVRSKSMGGVPKGAARRGVRTGSGAPRGGVRRAGVQMLTAEAKELNVLIHVHGLQPQSVVEGMNSEALLLDVATVGGLLVYAITGEGADTAVSLGALQRSVQARRALSKHAAWRTVSVEGHDLIEQMIMQQVTPAAALKHAWLTRHVARCETKPKTPAQSTSLKSESEAGLAARQRMTIALQERVAESASLLSLSSTDPPDGVGHTRLGARAATMTQ